MAQRFSIFWITPLNCTLYLASFHMAYRVGGQTLSRSLSDPDVLMVPMTAPSKYFCIAKITEAILNKIKVCGIFIIKFHLLKDDSRYHENKWHSLGFTKLHFFSYFSPLCIHSPINFAPKQHHLVREIATSANILPFFQIPLKIKMKVLLLLNQNF